MNIVPMHQKNDAENNLLVFRGASAASTISNHNEYAIVNEYKYVHESRLPENEEIEFRGLKVQLMLIFHEEYRWQNIFQCTYNYQRNTDFSRYFRIYNCKQPRSKRWFWTRYESKHHCIRWSSNRCINKL